MGIGGPIVMASTFLKFTNQTGFPCIESTGVNLTDAAETFTFNSHPFLRRQFQGGFWIKITDTPTAPATAVPIQFTTSGVANSTVTVYSATGTALTTATFPGNGIYLGFYDSDTGIVRLINVI